MIGLHIGGVSIPPPSAGSPTGLPAAFRELAADLKAAFRGWERDPVPWPEERLDEWARRAFRIQLAHNRPFRLFCRSRGIGADDVSSWRDVPAVPTAAFREVDLCLGGRDAARLVFRTSGTTRGRARRGRHPVIDPELYRRSLEATFRRHVLGDGERVRIGSLVPPFEPLRESSLSWMVEALIHRFGAPRSTFLSGPDGVRWAEAEAFVEEARRDGEPVLLFATTLGLAEWVSRLRREGRRLPLPPGSRVVDTGGTKGRSGLERDRVLAGAAVRLRVPPDRVVNEFGMTELLSQRYSRRAGSAGSEREAATGAPPPGDLEAGGGDLLHGPPWLRTRALDPVTLAERPEGEVGVLCHYDLANAGSVCAVVTEDTGRVRGEAVELRGRSEGAPPRGCSLATAELLAAQQGGAARESGVAREAGPARESGSGRGPGEGRT